MWKTNFIIRITNPIWWKIYSYFTILFFLDIKLLSWQLGNVIFKMLGWVILYWYYIKAKQICNTFSVPCEKSKIISFASSVLKNIVVFSFWSKFSVKLISWTAFWSVSSALCLLISIAITYIIFWNKDNPENNQLCNHLLDQFQIFECYHMFLNHFYWLIKKKMFSIDHNIVIFLQLKEIIVWNLFIVYNLQMIKKVYLLLKDLDQLNNVNIGFSSVLLIWLRFIPVNCSFKTWFQLL